MWRFLTARHHVEFMRAYLGPLRMAFYVLAGDKQSALEEDLISLVDHYKLSENDASVWSADYLEVVVARR